MNRVIPNIGEFRSSLTPKDRVKSIWWYDLLEDRFEGYSAYEVDKHTASKFNLKGIEESGRFVRGKVLNFESKNYLLIWTIGYRSHPQSIIERVLAKVEQQFDIESVIDETGNEIYKR